MSPQVLAALSARSTGTTTSTFVPYRDSKLTQLLWDGLRGSGRCLMLACLGPMRCAADESLNTLHFATMALRIKAEPVVLLDPQVGQAQGERRSGRGDAFRWARARAVGCHA